MDKIEIIKKAANDLDFFGKLTSPKTFYLKTPKFHTEIDSLLMDESLTQLLLEAPRGTAKCLSPETEIYLSNGQRKKIKDVEVGEEIVSVNEDLKFHNDIIVNKWKTESKPMFKVSTRSRKTIVASAEHKVLTFDGWKKVSELTQEDYIASPRRLPNYELPKEYTDEEIKLLAYIIAEGGTSDMGVRFTNFDDVITDDFKKCVDALGFETKQVKIHGEDLRGQYRVTSGASAWVRENGLQKCKATHKVIPQWVFGLPQKQKWIFIASMWDTDGWFTKDDAGITLANLELITQLQHILWMLGINSVVHERPNDKSGAWALYVTKDCMTDFIENIPLILKKEKAKKILNKKRYSLIDVYPNRVKKFYKNVEREFRENGVARVDNQYEITKDKFDRMVSYKPIPGWVRLKNADVYWDRVVTIEYDGVGEAYDVQVLNNANLLTNGLVTHNSTKTISKSLHHAVYGEGDKFIIIQSKARPEAINRLTKIKNILEYSPEFRDLYGYCGESIAEVWREDKITTRIGNSRVTIKALGTGQQVRGALEDDTRITLYLLDDPDSEENTLTKEQMEKNFDKFLGGIAGLDRRNGRVIVIGTPIRQGCIVDRLRNASGWTSVRYQSYDPQTKEPLWAEMYPYEWLMTKKEELKDLGRISKFYSEYMCEIVGEEDQLFKEEYWDDRRYTGHLETNKFDETFLVISSRNGIECKETIPVNTFIGIDPASSTKQSADYFVVFPVAMDSKKEIYCLPFFRGRVTPNEGVDHIMHQLKTVRPKRGGIETTGYQEMLRETVRERMMVEDVYCPGFENKDGYKPRTEKSLRLEQLHPFFIQKKVWIPEEGMQAFIDELLMYPRGKHDDTIDGFYYATRRMYPPDHEIRKEVAPLIRRENKTANKYAWMMPN